ncbi:MAG: ABC transporter substrate-binding protein [Psychroserpens sp.]|nr:ABC transporter substrate-binding protein [Psychroserpens sp.]
MVIKDQLNRNLDISETPKRIISLVPSQTELLCHLGLEECLVGVTKFCVHPSYLRKNKKVVGGTKTVHFDKIQDLNPDIILCNKEENTKEMISQLEQIAPVHISDIYTLEDSLELIEMYGVLFDKEKESKHLVMSIRKEWKVFSKSIQNIPNQHVAYLIWKNPFMVAAENTFINEMLAVNSFENVFKGQERYPEITIDALIEKNPDQILLSSEPFPFKEKDLIELQQRIPNSKIRIVDGEAFSWYGSRLLKSFEYFKTLHVLK